jgi:flagellar basal body-associated protein FliL
MLWVIVDILIGLLAVAVLGAVCWSGYRHVKALIRAAKQAGERVGAVTAQIDELQRQGASRRTP